MNQQDILDMWNLAINEVYYWKSVVRRFPENKNFSGLLQYWLGYRNNTLDVAIKLFGYQWCMNTLRERD